MLTTKELFAIEEGSDLSKLTFKGVWVYPILKHTLIKTANNKNITRLAGKQKKNFIIQLIRNISTITFAITNNLRPVDFLFFGHANDRRVEVDQKHFSVFADSFFEALNKEYKGLYIEAPNSQTPLHFGNNYTQPVYFEDGLIFKTLLKAKFKRYKIDALNVQVFTEFFKLVKQDFNTESFLREFSKYEAFYQAYLKLLKKTNPKIVFIICPYTPKLMALCSACKHLGIKTVEIQHGHIQSEHKGYIYKKIISTDLFPDYLFSFGNYFKDLIHSESQLYRGDSNIVVGNAGLYMIKNLSHKLENDLRSFIYHKIVIAISSQGMVNNKLIPFTLELSQHLPDKYVIVYKLHPDEYQEVTKYDGINKQKNIFLIKDNSYSIYDVLNIAHIHSTVFSTTAIESAYFGVPNIYIKLGAFSERIVKVKGYENWLASNPKEYIEILNAICLMDNEELSNKTKELAKQFFKEGAVDNFLVEAHRLLT